MFERLLTGYLFRAVRNYPVILLTGPRGVGKSSFLRRMASERCSFVSLDDYAERDLARRDPKQFLSTHRPPVMIEEVQYAPELFAYIKIFLDAHGDQNGLFLLTGSHKFSLMRGVEESLAGRMAVFDVLGLSGAELNENWFEIPFLPDSRWYAHKKEWRFAQITRDALYRRIWRGSFPEFIEMKPSDRTGFFRDYVRTFIDKEVAPSLHGDRDLIKFAKFMRVAASKTASVLNYAEIARDAAIDQRTAKKWLGHLIRAGLVYLCPPWTRRMSCRVVKSPKIYFLDTGLCAYLARYDTPEILEAGALSGAILETWVLCEILKSWWNESEEVTLYFIGGKNGERIDFLLEQNGELYPVLLSRGENPCKVPRGDLRLLNKMGMPHARATVLSLKEGIDDSGDGMNFVPISAI